MAVKVFQFLSIALAALCLVPVGAHFFELPAKINLEADAYLTVQQIYRGWALFGVAIVAAIASAGILAFSAALSRRQPLAMWLALAGGLATLVMFFLFVFPANQATENRTVLPANWQDLRTRWEYGHAVNAGITLLGFLALVLSALAWSA